MVAGLIFKDAEIADKIVFECVYNGVLPVRTYKNSIKLAPPLTINKEAILESFNVIKDAIIKVQSECLDTLE
jgi:acetylornithine/succinyldiaminopimelate/putrescine aminotransferase